MADSIRELILKAIEARYKEPFVSPESTQVIDTYPIANANVAGLIYSGWHTRKAQTFEVSSPTLITEIRHGLYRLGSPPGNVYADIFATDGSIASGKPVGAALLTSAPLAASSLAISPTITETVFACAPTLVDPGVYAAAVRYDGGGDISNAVGVGHDTTSPAHPGRYYSYTQAGVWSLQPADDDHCFSVIGRPNAIEQPAGLNVHRHYTRRGQVSDGPEFCVFFAGEKSNALLTNAADRTDSIGVRVRMAAPEGISGDEALDPLLVWAEVALLSEYTLGGLVSDIGLPEIDAISAREFADSWAEATLVFPVSYQTAWGDPRRAA